MAGPGAGAAPVASRSVVPKPRLVFDPQALASPLPTGMPPQGAAAKRMPDAYTKFEAFLVQTFVESMLPSDAPNVYGSGVAGKIWKSMLAEHLANAIAKGTAFGIADKIAKDRASRGKTEAPGVTAASRQDMRAGGVKTGAVADLNSLISATAQPRAVLPARHDGVT